MAATKREAVTASFHFLTRVVEGDDGPKVIPITHADLDALFSAIQSKPPPNLSDSKSADRIRHRQDVPFDSIEKVDARTIAGTYRASYWGHAYNNSEKGKITADSINLRPFHFIVYLSKSGALYISTQYLGLFGGYNALRATIERLLLPHQFISHSFNLSSTSYRDARPQEVQITLSNRNRSIAADNVIGRSSVVVFKKVKKDEVFEKIVTERLLSQLDRGSDQIRRALTELSNSSQLMSIADNDIEDGRVIVVVSGKRKTIQLLDGSGFATRFPLEVTLDPDGHPVYQESRDAMIKILGDEIISRSASV